MTTRPSLSSTTHPAAFGVRRALRVVGTARGLATGEAERVAMRHLELTGDRTSAVMAGLDVLALPLYDKTA